MTLVTLAPASVMFLMASMTWPPVVTMSSTRTTLSPFSSLPSMVLEVP